MQPAGGNSKVLVLGPSKAELLADMSQEEHAMESRRLRCRERLWTLSALVFAVGTSPCAEPSVRIETSEARFERRLGDFSQLAMTREGAQTVLRVGSETFALEDLLYLELATTSDEREPLVLFLRSEGEVAGRVAGGDADAVEWANGSLSGQPLRIPLEDVRGILVKRPPKDAAEAPSTSGLFDATREASRIVRLREELLSPSPRTDELILEGGRVQGVLDAVGVDGVRFHAQSLGTVNLPWSKIRALSLAAISEEPGRTGPPGSDAKEAKESVSPPRPRSRIQLRDGTMLPCEIVSLEGGKLSMRHKTLGSRTIDVSELIGIDFFGGRAVYLSDLEPAAIKEECGTLFRLKMPFRRDSSVVGTPLSMRGKTYRKGLGVHSYSLLEYDIAGDYQRFRAVIGLDDTAYPESGDPNVGKALFRVFRDGEKIFERAMSWKDEPVSIDLPVRGARRLALEVDYGGDAGCFDLALDRANWAEARLVR